MDVVGGVGEFDVERLESKFVNSYRDGDRVLYISVFNNVEESQDITEEQEVKWSPL